MPNTKNTRAIYNVLNKSSKILLTTHISPDGDALGSLAAFYLALKRLGKDVEMFVADALPVGFNFLPHLNLIQDNPTQLINSKFDTIIVLDAGVLERTGLEKYISSLSSNLINIDHHSSNDNFGHLNLIDTSSSSTSEIIYNLFKSLNIKIEAKIATCLLTGVITDTDFFVNPNTTSATLKIAGQLIRAGAKVNLILDNIYRQTKISHLKLWGKALSRLNIDSSTQIASTAIFQEDMDFNLDSSAFEGLANFLNNLTEAKASMLLREEDGNYIKGSLRTTHDDMDVEEIAKSYGGGGHKKAAGFRVRGKLVKDKNGVWKVETRN